MKTLSLKVLGCAAVFVLLTVAQAQTSDDAQTVPPPDTNVPPPDTAAQGQNEATPNVIVVPVPADMLETNTDAGMNGAPPPGGVNTQPMQNAQSNGPAQNQYQNRNADRGRGRFDRRDSGQQRPLGSVGGNAAAYVPPTGAGTNGTGDLYLNFRGAPIDEVLNYLSDAAGFIIELDTRVSGTVDVFSAQPVSKDEAVQLLNSVLNKNGYAAVRSGRTLRIMSHEDAMHSDIRVVVSNEPDTIPKTDEIVTQIIPIRYVQARQLITDLSPLTSSHATIIANDAGNSIIVTDTQANIRHLVEIVKAIDSSAEDVTEVKVFHLQYHDPVEVATLLTSVFADQSGAQGGNNQSTPIRFGGFGGGGGLRQFFGGGGGGGGGFPGAGGFGGGRGGGGGGQGGGNSQADRIRQRAHVVAVPDQRTQSVLVTAPKDLMTEIDQLIAQVDQESPKVAHVSVIHLENADPQQVQKVLQDFQANNGRNSQNSQNSALMQRQNQNNSSSSTGFGTSGIGGGGGGGGTGFGGGGGGGFGGGAGGGFRGGGQ
jgi:hypothetical protein